MPELDNRNKMPSQEINLSELDAPQEEIQITEEQNNVDDVPTDEPTPIDLGDEAEDTSEQKRILPVRDEIDYKEKFRESSREALTLHFKNQKLTETIEEASKLPEPTEEDLVSYAREQGADYDDLDQFSKNILKKTYLNEKRFEKINEVNKEYKDVQNWVGKVDNFLGAVETTAKYPELVDNAEEFRQFSLKSSRRGTDLEDLATAFLYGLTQTQGTKKKGSLLMNGGNGATQEAKPQGLDEKQLASIRMSNPKEYRRLIKEGKASLDF